MTSLVKKPYKGCRDFFPRQKREQDFLFSHMHQTAKLYGFEHYDGPMLELVELYKAKSGEELINEQLYSFQDRGERFVAIRPEMTPTVARMIAQVHREIPKPIKWYSIPNLMRYEKPQRGRLREHWQFNCDIFGAADNLAEIEVLTVAKHLLNSFGANQKHFEILINDREIVDVLFSSLLQVGEDTSYKLYKIIDKSKKVSSEKLKVMIETHLDTSQSEILTQYLNIKSFDELKNFFQKHNQEFPNRFQNFIQLALQTELKDYLVYDPSIVRGLDYYTGIVFEIFDKHPDNLRAICGGGAYANLLKIFNEPALPGVGFGLGDVTLTDFLKAHQLLPDFSKSKPKVFLSFENSEFVSMALKVSNQLRKDIQVDMLLTPVKIKKAFQIAEKKEAQFIVLIKDNDHFEIKNFKTKNNLEFNSSNLDAVLEFING